MNAQELKRYLARQGCTFETHKAGSGHITVRRGELLRAGPGVRSRAGLCAGSGVRPRASVLLLVVLRRLCPGGGLPRQAGQTLPLSAPGSMRQIVRAGSFLPALPVE